MTEPQLTPESMKALADTVIEAQVIPKKVPHVDDVDAQAKSIVGALSSAMLMATDTPLTIPPAILGDIAAQLVAYGVRQTEHVDPEAIHAPAWITDGVRQESTPLPDQYPHTEAPPIVARTDVAPKPPKRIADHARAVKR